MKRHVLVPLRNLLAFVILPFSAGPLLAQVADRPGPGWGWDGYGPMMGGWGWHPGMIVGGIMMLLVLTAVILLIAWLLRSLTHGHGTGSGFGHYRHGSALDILAERFARGEIDKDEFEDKRRVIGR